MQLEVYTVHVKPNILAELLTVNPFFTIVKIKAPYVFI